MASGLGRALRRGRCDMCGRRCVWCGWPRDDSDSLDDDGDVVDAKPGGTGEGHGELGWPTAGHLHPSWSPVRFVGDADGARLTRRDEVRGGCPSQAHLHSSWSPLRFVGDADGGQLTRRDEVRGCCLSPTRLHPLRSPARFASDGDGAGIDCRSEVQQNGGEVQDGERQRRTWWSRFHQRVFTEGVDFVPDSQEGPGDEFVLLTDSNEERDGGLLVSPDEDEVVPETEFQEQDADGSTKQACTMDGGVLLCSIDGPAKGNVTNAACVSSDAETEDENGTEDDVRVNLSVNSKLEDFKTELLRLHVPGYTHCLKRKRD